MIKLQLQDKAAGQRGGNVGRAGRGVARLDAGSADQRRAASVISAVDVPCDDRIRRLVRTLHATEDLHRTRLMLVAKASQLVVQARFLTA
jgi:hypothetical protein